VHFSLPFPTYFTLETKSEFGTNRVEKGIEDNFLNEHPILIKQNTKLLSGILALEEQGFYISFLKKRVFKRFIV
jgi:hypothetical protein